MDLYAKDRGHPGYKGSYIYACLLYSVITGKNPSGLTSEFKNDTGIKWSIIIDKKEAAEMQKVAWNQNRDRAKSGECLYPEPCALRPEQSATNTRMPARKPTTGIPLYALLFR